MKTTIPPMKSDTKYWVRGLFNHDSCVFLAYWDGEDWVSLQPAYEYKLEEYTLEDRGWDITHWHDANAPDFDINEQP